MLLAGILAMYWMVRECGEDLGSDGSYGRFGLHLISGALAPHSVIIFHFEPGSQGIPPSILRSLELVDSIWLASWLIAVWVRSLQSSDKAGVISPENSRPEKEKMPELIRRLGVFV